MKTNKHINNAINNYTRGLSALARLADGVQVPTSFHPFINCFDGEVSLTAYCYDYNRDEILMAAAECFSGDGWEEIADGKDLHWHKTLNKIKIVINNANVTPPVLPRPVRATEFPCLLKNLSTEEVA